MTNKINIAGKVIKGDGYGKMIGFPTINLDRRNFSKIKGKPKFGVYSGKVKIDNKEHRAGIIIGPLDQKGLPKIEAHLIGFSGNAYGKVASIEIKKFIRPYKKFKTESELVAQIVKDLKKC